MTIRDVLSQMTQLAARPARTGGKAALHEAEENGSDETLANFEALVREMSGKAEARRGNRVSEVRDVSEDEEKSEREEADPLVSLAAQAVPALVPFFVRQAEVVASEDTDVPAITSKGKSGRANPDEETALDEPVDADGVEAKAGQLKNPEEQTAEPAVRKRADQAIAKSSDTPVLPSTNNDGAVSSPTSETVSSQAAASSEPEKPTQAADIASPPVRGGEAVNGERMTLVVQASSRPSAPAPAPSVAAPVRPAMPLAGVEIVSERANGVAKTLHIRLQPEELGVVTARLRLVPDGMQVELVADRRETAERLAADRDMLGKALQSVGLSDNAVIAVTVTERASSSSANMAGGQPGQQNFTAQDQSGGRNGPQAQMQGEGNGNRGERGRGTEQEQQGASSGQVEQTQDRRLSRGLVV